jgi:hypothetical protein
MVTYDLLSKTHRSATSNHRALEPPRNVCLLQVAIDIFYLLRSLAEAGVRLLEFHNLKVDHNHAQIHAIYFEMQWTIRRAAAFVPRFTLLLGPQDYIPRLHVSLDNAQRVDIEENGESADDDSFLMYAAHVWAISCGTRMRGSVPCTYSMRMTLTVLFC